MLERSAFQVVADKAIQPGWHVVIAPISERSFGIAALYDETLAAFSPTGTNYYQQDLAMKKARGDLTKVLATLETSSAGSDRTEIIAALGAASERFASDENAGKKLLVILTPGFEQSSIVNMGDYHLNLNDAVSDRIIRHLEALGTMPRLAGVRVCMAGVTAGDRRWADYKRQINIEHFWHTFFSRAGAQLTGYSPSLATCRELQR